MTHNPTPDRFDGDPPQPETSGVLVASLTSLSGLLSQIVPAQIPMERLYFYTNDHIGTPVAITDEAGDTVWEADYTPFGGIYR